MYAGQKASDSTLRSDWQWMTERSPLGRPTVAAYTCKKRWPAKTASNTCKGLLTEGDLLVVYHNSSMFLCRVSTCTVVVSSNAVLTWSQTVWVLGRTASQRFSAVADGEGAPRYPAQPHIGSLSSGGDQPTGGTNNDVKAHFKLSTRSLHCCRQTVSSSNNFYKCLVRHVLANFSNDN